MRICSIASGSSGNCIYVGTDHTNLMIDAGISGKRIEAGCHELGLQLKELQGIMITHEHSDHIAGLGVIARRYGIPIYTTKGTKEAILGSKSLGKIDPDLINAIEPEVSFTLGDITVLPMSISHDAAEPVAYLMRKGKKSIGVLTDLGKYDYNIIEKLQGIDVMLLEANHDINMLQVGNYPYYLKQRILGERGHLSNELSGQLLCELLHDNFKAVILAHLSKENNYEKLAYETVRLEITMGNTPYSGNDFPIYVAKRDSVSELVEV